MPEPTLLGIPLSLLFLFFLFYSFAGWLMETVYCSCVERRFVARGFLYGPVCPIYGVGVLLMILFFRPFIGQPTLFYLVSVLVMSAWEYFVGWVLETTTHMKYWDYSRFRFNVKGRICLWNSLIWGILSYLMLFFVHPQVNKLFELMPLMARWISAGVLYLVFLVDSITTVRKLALMNKVMNKLEQVSGELQIQFTLGKAELNTFLDSAKDNLSDRIAALDSAKDNLSDRIAAVTPDNVGEAAQQFREKYNEVLRAAVRHSSRFRNRYRDMTSVRHPYRLEDVKTAGTLLRERLLATKQKRREQKKEETEKVAK